MAGLILFLAQNAARFNRGMVYFQWGLTLAGVGVIVVGIGLAFSKPRDSRPQTPAIVRWSALGICTALGLGLIAFAWLGFSQI